MSALLDSAEIADILLSPTLPPKSVTTEGRGIRAVAAIILLPT